MNSVDVAVVCKALGDANRLEIIKMLADGEKCGCELLEKFQITQPTLSHHMKILCDSGLVIGRKQGKWMHYSISMEGAKVAMDCLKEITAVTECESESKCCNK